MKNHIQMLLNFKIQSIQLIQLDLVHKDIILQDEIIKKDSH